MASRLATILEKEYKTKGVISGLASATGKRALEKLDIRNALFGGSGIGSAIGRKIFGKGYSATRGDQKVSSSPVEKLSELSTTANSGAGYPYSGGVFSASLGQPVNLMNPYLTINYIISNSYVKIKFLYWSALFGRTHLLHHNLHKQNRIGINVPIAINTGNIIDESSNE